MKLNTSKVYLVKRTGQGNDRVTHGKHYVARYRETWAPHGQTPISSWIIDCTDDPSKTTCPSLTGTLWKVCSELPEHIISKTGVVWLKKVKNSRASNSQIGDIACVYAATGRVAPESPTQNIIFGEASLTGKNPDWIMLYPLEIELSLNQPQTTKEEPVMTTLKEPNQVEVATLINKQEASDISSEKLIALIKEEQESIEQLAAVKVESTFIKARIAAHEEAIRCLVKVLDARKA